MINYFRKYGFGYLLLSPVVIYLVLFQFYPLFQTIYTSFYDYSLVYSKEMKFIGFGNYKKLFTDDINFWLILKNSFIWVAGSTLLQFLIAIPAALILNNRLPARGLWRGLMMVPWVSPVIIVGLIWKWIYDGHNGLANYYLTKLHVISENIIWLGDDFWVWPALLLTSAWKGFPYIALMLLAGLTGISKDMIEASHIDGATSWQRFTKIILPLLKPIMYVTGMVAIIGTWTKFEMIWALTNGGPGFATSILPTYVYTNAFVYFDFGLGSTVATVSIVVVLLFAGIYALLFGKDNQ